MRFRASGQNSGRKRKKSSTHNTSTLEVGAALDRSHSCTTMPDTRPNSKLFQRVRRGLASSLNSSADESSEEEVLQLTVPSKSATSEKSTTSDEMMLLAMRLENGFQGATSTVTRCRSAGATGPNTINTSGSTTEEVSSMEGSDNEMDRQYGEGEATLVITTSAKIASLSGIEETTEFVLRSLLNYSRAHSLFFFRAETSGRLVLDGSLSKQHTWTLLQRIPLARTNVVSRTVLLRCKNTLRPIHLQGRLEMSDLEDTFTESGESTNSDGGGHSTDALLCIPLVQMGNFEGCIYLESHSPANMFVHVNCTIVALIASNLMGIINNSLLKTQLIQWSTRDMKPTIAHKIPGVVLQDTLKFYELRSSAWVERFVVLAQEKLFVFLSPHDTNPNQIIQLLKVKDIRCSGEKSSSASPLPRRPTMSKSMASMHSFLFMDREEEEPLWLASESFQTIQLWFTTLQKNQSIISEDPRYYNIPEQIRLNVSDIQLDRIIGSGGGATVYQGVWNRTPVAVKQLYEALDEREAHHFYDELNALHSLRHPNIITLYGGFISPSGRASIVLELASRGALCSVLYDPLLEITAQIKKKIVVETIRALNVLHSHSPPYIHRDLKPGNILITDDWSAKLADFGLAKKVNATLTTQQGTVKWMAPEVLQGAPYTTSADIYSFALIAWEVIMQENILADFKFNSVVEVQVVNHNARPPLEGRFPLVLRSIISRCWDANPAKRPSANDVIEELTNCDAECFSPVVL